MRSNTPITRTCLPSVVCACCLIDEAVSATCTTKQTHASLRS